MDIVQRFDPWRSPICTCPEKYSLNPYTGCDHRCIYCYSTFIPRFYEPRRKKDLLKRVEKDLKKLKEGSIISLSNSSDPYLHLDEKYKDTRKILELFQNYDLRILIITKSDLVLRDIDLLKKLNVAITFTITTFDKKIYEKLEPNAPSSERRLKAIKILNENKLNVAVRIDPIFPYLTEGEIKLIIREVKEAGAKHITASTFKLRKDSWLRFKDAFPEIAAKLNLYFKNGQKIGNSLYLPRDLRKGLMLRVKNECEKYNLSFATCREGFSQMQTSSSCDGSHLIKMSSISNKRGVK